MKVFMEYSKTVPLVASVQTCLELVAGIKLTIRIYLQKVDEDEH